MWARFLRLLDTNGQTDRQAKYTFRFAWKETKSEPKKDNFSNLVMYKFSNVYLNNSNIFHTNLEIFKFMPNENII